MAVGPTASANGYGSFTMTAAGVWAYTLDNANSAVQALNVGDTLTDSFTVTTVDGTPQLVTITITGTQRRGHHLRHHDRLGDRGRQLPRPARRPRPARSPTPTSTIRPTPSRPLDRRRARAATAASR